MVPYAPFVGSEPSAKLNNATGDILVSGIGVKPQSEIVPLKSTADKIPNGTVEVYSYPFPKLTTSSNAVPIGGTVMLVEVGPGLVVLVTVMFDPVGL